MCKIVQMKRGVYILSILLFIAVSAIAQNSNAILAKAISDSPTTVNESEKNGYNSSEIDIFLSTARDKSIPELEEYKSSLLEFIQKMADKNVRNEKYFLENLFYKVHNKYLKHYTNYVTFDEIFNKGYYDCVTGTALYALILNELGYDYSIYESDFHVLMLVKIHNEEFLFESTDFNAGFIDDPDQIRIRLSQYESMNMEKSDSHYNYQINNNRFISTRQLAGLLYFNLAVEQYNEQNFTYANFYLEKAELLYPGSRINELKELINKMARAEQSFSLNR